MDFPKNFEYAFLTFGALFAIVDPFAAIPTFLAMTTDVSVKERRHMARIAAMVAGGVMALFAALGQAIFKMFGITLPAFQIAGGLIMLLSALDMLRAKRSPLKETDEEREEGIGKHDIAITPLAIPMLSGPGAITTSIVLFGHAGTWTHKIIFFVCIAATAAASYAILAVAATGAKKISATVMNVMARLMGLMLAAIGIQFILSALKIGGS